MSPVPSSQPGVPLEARAPAYSWYALVLLTLVYVLNFLDRQLIYILFTPIQAEMKLTDLELALLGTTSSAPRPTRSAPPMKASPWQSAPGGSRTSRASAIRSPAPCPPSPAAGWT